MNRSLFLLFGMFLLACAGHTQAAPRDDVQRVAQAIQDRFYDAERGARIADELRTAAARGEFDDFTDPRELASTLSQWLKPRDAHFNVRWSAEDAAPPQARSGPGPMPRRPPPAGNYGIRRVEILPGNIGYLDLRQFAHFPWDQADAPARLAIEAALQLLSGTDAMIIDLRANGGGSPAMVGYLSSAFTPRGADIYNTFHSREGSSSEAPEAWYPHPRLQVPLFVLISGRTGSAAEAFAYTLQNAKRATLVGEASGGAANPGGEIAVGNGYRVFVADGSPINPITHRNWEGSGVAPEVNVSAESALDRARQLALEAIIAGAPADAAVEARWALEAQQAQAAGRQSGALPDYLGNYGALSFRAEAGHLVMQRGRRPALALAPLGGDAFGVAAEPSQRVGFQRDAQGRVIAVETYSADGQSARYRRGD